MADTGTFSNVITSESSTLFPHVLKKVVALDHLSLGGIAGSASSTLKIYICVVVFHSSQRPGHHRFCEGEQHAAPH